MKNIKTHLRNAAIAIILVFSIGTSYGNNFQSLLWKVTGGDLQHPVYIFGSIHVLPQNDFIMLDTISGILQQSSLVVFEIDLVHPDLSTDIQKGMLMAETSLKELLNSDDYEVLKTFTEDSLGVPIDAVNNVKPLLFSSFLVPKIIGSQPASYDFYFFQQAQGLSIEVAGLETVSEQFGYFDAIPLNEQAQMLMESVKNFDMEKYYFGKMIEIYKEQDVEKLYELTVDMAKEHERFINILIHKRNEEWVPRITGLCGEETCFVVVGCAHLGGEKGVINLLRKEGYSVKPVRLIND